MDDILAIRNKKNRVHYMGAIVLQDLNDKQYSIIDGQQRIATLSIIALAVIKRIQDLIDSGIEVEENEERKETVYGAVHRLERGCLITIFQ